ncbi:MAG TPA: type II toxin-antitoxin system VapC family toxin [Thermoanaerobaculia bacterium]|nr:type II toxin-antitoxin system VapC family toxin [Thermoanaerobaculia bacterium]
MILLDTHSWIWWAVGSAKLSARARTSIDEARAIGVSAISCWEVAMLVQRRRITFDRDTLLWVQQALARPAIRLLPITPQVAVRSTQLGAAAPADPADRLIIATAREAKIPVVTRDTTIIESGLCDTLW